MKDVFTRNQNGQLAIKAADFELTVGKEVSEVFDGIRSDLIDFNLFDGSELSLSVYKTYRSEKKRAGSIGPVPAQEITDVDSVDVEKVTPEGESVNSEKKGRK